jgi:peptidoglycan/LPS O-acetylase OafA/YrhL
LNTIPLHKLSLLEENRIEALRGFLCFIVYIYHLSRGYPDTAFYNAVNSGYISVQIFFAISGFLILHSYSKLNHANAPRIVSAFYLKRFFKIFPVWFVVLICAFCFRRMTSLEGFFSNLFFLYSLKPYNIFDLWVIPSWSLYIEILFYIAFPVLVFVLKKKDLFLLTILFFIVGRLFFDKYNTTPPGLNYNSPFNTFYFFFYGMAAYYGIEYLRNISQFILPVALLFIMTCSWYMGNHWSFVECYILIAFISIFGKDSLVQSWFTKIFGKLGRISYGFYLVHTLTNGSTKRLFFKFGLMNWTASVIVVSFILTIVCAYALTVAIERPAVKFGNKLIKNIQPRAIEAEIAT